MNEKKKGFWSEAIRAGGTSVTTTALAPTFAFSPTSIGPKS